MKTYWLIGPNHNNDDNITADDNRLTTMTHSINDTTIANPKTDSNIKHMSQSSLGDNELRSLYSPVSFDDVIKNKMVISPMKASSKQDVPKILLQADTFRNESKDNILCTVEFKPSPTMHQAESSNEKSSLGSNKKQIVDNLDSKSQTCHLL